MPFRKKNGASGKLTRRKGKYKNNGKNNANKQQEISQVESSDEFFRTCLGALIIPESDSSTDVSPGDGTDNDTSKADEYYVILDKPYQYFDHDDLDTFVASKCARMFSTFKEMANNFDEYNFVCMKSSDLIRYVQLYDRDIVNVKTLVTVDKTFRVTIQVHDQKLSDNHEIWSTIPRICYSIAALGNILSIVSTYNVCVGNYDPELQEHASIGAFLDSKDGPKRLGYRTLYTGRSTILSSSCQLLVKGSRCKCCKVYRKTLRSLHVRKGENVPTPEKDWLHSRTPNMRLTENQKIHKLKQYKDYTDSLKKELNSLRHKFHSEIEKKGVTLTENDSDDFMNILETGTGSKNTNNNNRLNEDSYKQLFWEQQIKYNKLKDKRQMRWHPMLIKWCIFLRSKSSSSYDAMRKSGFVALPSERLLFDYTHLVEQGTGFQPDVIKMLHREVYQDEAPSLLPKHRKIVGILHDEIRIKSDLVYDKHSGELVGFVDLDKIGNDLNHITECMKNEDRQLAKHVLVLMVRGVASSLKFPLAHFATTGVTSDQLFPILWKAVEILETDLGLCTLFITSDGASPNRRFTRLHRINDEQGAVYRTVNIFAPEQRYLYFISDPPHLIKTVRNCFSNSYSHKKSRKMWNGKDISWLQIVDLFKDHCTGIYRYCPKLTREHVNISSFGCMKVNYAAQVLSSTVADALEILYGENTSETVIFIRHMNKFFDCMNVRNRYEGNRTRNPNMHPYQTVDDERLQYLLNEFLQYFDEWRTCVENRPGNFTKADRNSMQLSYQTLEGLEMTVKSVVECVKYCLDNGVDYVLTEKFN